jgi:hypothetical protein
MLALTPQASADTAKTCPPLTQGYWKNHTSVWAKQKLTLGTTTYTQAQAEAILQTPVGGDASVNLAHQLIAALLNIMVTGTDSTPIAKTIADANALLGAGPIPEGIDPSSTVGQEMVADAGTLDSFNNDAITSACGAPVVTGSCQPSSSLSVLVSGTNVTAYVPKARWSVTTPVGVSVVNVEGTSITPTLISTPGAVNSCASNALTGETVCTENTSNVDFFSGTTKTVTLTSSGTGTIGFSGGSCTNCGVAMDASHDRAVIGLSIAGAPGFQFIDLSTPTPSFGAAFTSPAAKISEDPLIDPIRNFVLSAAETNNYEIVNVSTSTPAFFEHPVSIGGELDSSGEDCGTGIALAPAEFNVPSRVFIADLTQATFTPGSPGTWTTPATAAQVQTLSESNLAAGSSGIAVAQGTHLGIVSGEFGGNAITAIALPTTSGSGTPAITDWVSCNIPSFSNGFDPHTVTAYQSPNGGERRDRIAGEWRRERTRGGRPDADAEHHYCAAHLGRSRLRIRYAARDGRQLHHRAVSSNSYALRPPHLLAKSR